MSIYSQHKKINLNPLLCEADLRLIENIMGKNYFLFFGVGCELDPYISIEDSSILLTIFTMKLCSTHKFDDFLSKDFYIYDMRGVPLTASEKKQFIDIIMPIIFSLVV